MEIIEHFKKIYEKASNLISQSKNEYIKKIKPYIATKFKFEIIDVDYIGAVERKSIDEELEVLVGKDYCDFSINGGDLSKIENLYTSLHELFENALYLKNGEKHWCPKANALACIILTGRLDEKIKDYINKKWGYISYLPDERKDSGRKIVEFCKKLSREYEISIESSYVYLRTNTLLSRESFNNKEKAKNYVLEVNLNGI